MLTHNRFVYIWYFPTPKRISDSVVWYCSIAKLNTTWNMISQSIFWILPIGQWALYSNQPMNSDISCCSALLLKKIHSISSVSAVFDQNASSTVVTIHYTTLLSKFRLSEPQWLIEGRNNSQPDLWCVCKIVCLLCVKSQARILTPCLKQGLES